MITMNYLVITTLYPHTGEKFAAHIEPTLEKAKANREYFRKEKNLYAWIIKNDGNLTKHLTTEWLNKHDIQPESSDRISHGLNKMLGR